tara:strand:- start:244 stop:606 length:363 start_codon:yes stop_codon:yes gene_type:complete
MPTRTFIQKDLKRKEEEAAPKRFSFRPLDHSSVASIRSEQESLQLTVVLKRIVLKADILNPSLESNRHKTGKKPNASLCDCSKLFIHLIKALFAVQALMTLKIIFYGISNTVHKPKGLKA